MLKLIYLLSLLFSFSTMASKGELIQLDYEVKDKFTKNLSLKHTNFIVETKEQFNEAIARIKKLSNNKKLDYAVRSLYKDSGFSKKSDIQNIPFRKNSLRPVALGLGSTIMGAKVIDLTIGEIGLPTESSRNPSSKDVKKSKNWKDPLYLGEWFNKHGRMNLAFTRGFINGVVSFAGLQVSGMVSHAAFVTSAVVGSLSGTLNWYNDQFSDLVGSTKYEEKLLDTLAERYSFFRNIKNRNSGSKLPKFFSKTGGFTYKNLKWLLSDFIFIKIIMLSGSALDASGIIHGYHNFYDQLQVAGVTALKGLGSQGLFDLSVAQDFSKRVTSFDEAMTKVEATIEAKGKGATYTQKEAMSLLRNSDILESTFKRYKDDISKISNLSAEVLLERLKIHKGAIQLYRVGWTMTGSAVWAFASILDLVGISLGDKVFVGLMSAGAINYLRLLVKKPKLIKNCSNYLDE